MALVSHEAITEPNTTVTWYIPEDQAIPAWVHPTSIEITQEVVRRLRGLSQSVLQNYGQADFMVRDTEEDRLYRGHRAVAEHGSVFVLREVTPSRPTLDHEALRYPAMIRKALLSDELLRGGLFLIVGTTGDGKSTTAAATVISRLHRFGGVAVTVEDPPEFILSGAYSDGFCLQMPVNSANGGFAAGIKSALRCYPSGLRSTQLFIGEIRDSLSATETLRACLNGHLVIATLHALDIPSAIKRMISLAGSSMNRNSDEAAEILGEGFRGCIHQRLTRNGPEMTMLVANQNNTSVMSHIRNGDVHLLRSDIQRQEGLMKVGRLPWE